MLLPSGRLLAVGGSRSPNPTNDVELLDPTSPTLAAQGAAASGNLGARVTLLATGHALRTGGDDAGSAVASVELYDPLLNAWTPAQPMTAPREDHAAALLSSGRVLVAGGAASSNGAAIPSAELFDPHTGTWSPTNSMAQARRRFTLSVLDDGSVLAVGGSDGTNALASTERYLPDLGVWVDAGMLGTARAGHTASPAAGQVLVTGGQTGPGLGAPTRNTEHFSLDGGWQAAPPLNAARRDHAAIPLQNGDVLVAGGFDGGYLGSAERWSLGHGWTTVGALTTPRDDLMPHAHRAPERRGAGVGRRDASHWGRRGDHRRA